MRLALQLDRVEKRYGKRRALDGLTVDVREGQVFGLVGSNGAGKTTALSIAAGIARPTGGRVNILEQGPFDAVRLAGRLSFMPQDTWLAGHAGVRDTLIFYARLQGLGTRDAERAADAALDGVHLTDRAHARIKTLSHGMRRRVLIAQAFLGDPDVILLDEPLSGLDPREVVNIRRILTQRRANQTVVISSHNLAEIEKICDHVAFIEQGRRVRQDTMERVTGRGQTLIYVLGSSDVPWDRLESALPEAGTSFRWLDEPHRGEPGAVCLQCDFGNGVPANDINAAILPCLLEADVPVFGIRHGAELEHAYLTATATGRDNAPPPSQRPRSTAIG